MAPKLALQFEEKSGLLRPPAFASLDTGKGLIWL
jgi:hypothetical protein